MERNYNNLSRIIFLEYAPRINTLVENVVLGTDIAITGFSALYYGTGEYTRKELDKKHFKQLYSIPDQDGDRCSIKAIALLSTDNVRGGLKPQFEKDVKANCTKNFFYNIAHFGMLLENIK